MATSSLREDEQIERLEGHEYRSWNEVNGEFVMHIVERSGDGLYGPEHMQSVEVTKPPSNLQQLPQTNAFGFSLGTD